MVLVISCKTVKLKDCKTLLKCNSKFIYSEYSATTVQHKVLHSDDTGSQVLMNAALPQHSYGKIFSTGTHTQKTQVHFPHR